MRKIILDVECTTSKLNDKYSDYSPYNPNNKLVSIGWMVMENNQIGPVNYLFIHHNEIKKWDKTNIDNQPLRSRLERDFREDIYSCDTIIAHNAKFDISWLEECGFDCSGKGIEDTMIREYIMARGRSDISFRLADTCKRYKVAEKGELFEKYPDLQISEMPIEEVEDYGRSDIQACAELYLAQEERLSNSSYQSLLPTIKLTNDFCRTLIDVERSGVNIDEAALEDVRQEFTNEADLLERDLQKYVREVMGDTKVNLDSPQQLSEVIYSRRIKEGMEEEWVRTFNIGKNDRGKLLKRPKMSFEQYAHHVKRMTDVIRKTEVFACPDCVGKGSIHKTKKDGSLFKKPTRCKSCDNGAQYRKLEEPAGFKMRPNNINFTTVNGFSTSQTFLDEIQKDAELAGKREAADFLEKVMRLSSLRSYLSTFVEGITLFKQTDRFLHPNFMQCVTATGRLSSRAPNLQNQPRENTFPIRKIFVSRWGGGKIVDVDFSGVEFRAAVHLARDDNGRKDILDGKDLHEQTREIISRAGTHITRQQAKSHSFKPLYFGGSGTEQEREYYRAFTSTLYPKIGVWHNRLSEEAISKHIIQTETGRQFIFPDVERGWNGKATRMTQIVNYPVQSFATADLAPAATYRLNMEIRNLGLKSRIVLLVHDSVVVDCHPDEIDIVNSLCRQLGKFAEEEATKRWGITMFVPLGCEVKLGDNAMQMKKVA